MTQSPEKGNHLLHRPHELTVIGVDTPDADDHYLYDHRAIEFVERLKHPKYQAVVDAYYKQEVPPALSEIAESVELATDLVAAVIKQESFIRSIMKSGVRTPIDATKDGTLNVVVTGRLRVLAAREAELRMKGQGELKVPTMVFSGDEERSLDAVISENENRTEDSPLNRGRKAIKMISVGGKTVNQVARLFQVDPKTVNQWMKLVTSPLALQDMVETGKVSPSAAIRLASSTLTRAEKIEAVQEMVKSGDVTTAAAAAHVRRAKADRAPKTPAQQRSAKKASRSNGGQAVVSPVIKRPSNRQLRWAAKWGKETGELATEVVQTILWVLGDIPASRVTGMAKALRAAEKGKASKTEAPADEAPADEAQVTLELGDKPPKKPKPQGKTAKSETPKKKKTPPRNPGAKKVAKKKVARKGKK